MSMPKSVTFMVAGIAAMSICAAGDATVAAERVIAVVADFGVQADYPLSKTKFAVYNSGWVPLERYERDMPLYDEVRPYSLRIDLGWGTSRWRHAQPVDGTADNIRYDFREMDRLATQLNGHGVLPYWAYSYLPPPLQATPGKPNGAATRPAALGDILATFVKHSTTSPAMRVGFHEIYNEPDNRDFFRGSVNDYLELYRAGSRAIRNADRDAVIGGPAIAFTDGWVRPFLDAVTREQLPLDFFSFHFYPTVPYASPNVAGVIRDMRAALAERPELATTEMHLNEFNSYRIEYPEGGRQDRYALASAMLHDFAYLLTQPDLTQVNWAQFQDTGGGNWSGMISIDGRRKATFNAYYLYQQMPVDRVQLTVAGPAEVEGFASVDSGGAAVLLWNRTESEQSIRLDFERLGFATGTLRVLRIDADHASWGDSPAAERLVPVEARSNVATAEFAWEGNVPTHGIVYVELTDNAASAREERPAPAARFVRVLRHFPNRASSSYADFEPRTWTARLGMGTETHASERLGVVMDEVSDLIEVRVELDGEVRQLDESSLLGLRVDYETAQGFTYSVIFHGPCGTAPALINAEQEAALPWGTQRAADRAIRVPDLSRFRFAPAEYAPQGWTGLAQVTFIMQNTGPATRAKFQLLGGPA